MNSFFKAVITGLFLLTFSTIGIAAERGTLDDAIAMVKKAKAYMKANGNEKAFAEFSNPKGQFVDRDIYIYVYDKKGKNLAHGGNQRLIGKDLFDLKDTDGTLITQGLLEVAGKGGGTLRFKFLNPVTSTVEQKTGYAEMAGDVMVGSGAYTK